MPDMRPPRTSGLRIMLLGLLGCHIGLALAFWLGDRRRFSGTGFATALDVLTRHEWAAVFAFGAVTLAATWARRRALVAQLAVGMFIYLFWSACFVLSAIHSDSASVTGPIVWAVVGVAHAACASTVFGQFPPEWRGTIQRTFHRDRE